MTGPDSNESKSSRRVYLIVFSTYLISFTNDAAISWSSPVLPQLRYHDPKLNHFGRRITESEESWLGSLLSLGNAVGLILYGYLCYKFGRKHTLTSLGLLHAIGFLLFTTKSLTCYFLGRFLNGVASGVGYIMFPMYIAEICQDGDRGLLLVSRQIFSSCGTLFAYVAGNYLPIVWFNIILSIFPLLYLISFSILAIESPFFHVMNENIDTARRVYSVLDPKKTHKIEENIDEIQKAVEMTQAENLKEALSRKSVQKAICLVYFMVIFQQLTGYMPLATYTEEIVRSRKSMVLVGVFLLLGSTFSALVIDRRGRKLLLYISLSGIIIAEILFSSFFYYLPHSEALRVVFVTSFFLLYNVGVAFLPQIILAEILPVSVKFKVASTAGVLGWSTAFILTKIFLGLIHSFGLHWVIFAFAVCSIVYLIVVWRFLPETNGRSFRQIQSLLEMNIEVIE